MAIPLNWCTPLASKRLTLRQTVLFGMLGALTFAAKVAMAALPNIEPVSLFVMLFAVTFGIKCIYPIAIYVMMEWLCYGLGPYSFPYLYIWFILALGAWLLRNTKEPLAWAILSGAFGLMFGFLSALVYLFIGGVGQMISMWIAGITFDLLHCVGNFVIALVLFVPLRKLLYRLYINIQR